MPRFSVSTPKSPLDSVYGRQSRAFNQRPAVGSGEAGRKSVNYSKMVLEQLVAAGLPEPALEFFFAKDDLGREWRADRLKPAASHAVSTAVDKVGFRSSFSCGTCKIC